MSALIPRTRGSGHQRRAGWRIGATAPARRTATAAATGKTATAAAAPARRTATATAAAVALGLVLSGCSAGGGDAPAGGTEVSIPGGETLTVDAATVLGNGQFLPDRENYVIAAEHWTATMDGEEPVLVGLVRTTHTMHYRGYTEDEYVTFVLGVSADGASRELTRTRILRGAEHTAELAGRSDQGVVAVILEGELNTNVPRDSRVIGVDAVRGTEVWVKEHGYARSTDGAAWFYAASSPDACATEVQRFDVASGIPQATESILNTDPAAGGTCVTANDPEPPSGLLAG